MLTTLHIVCAIIAIACGALVFVFQKGTWLHVLFGRFYVISMTLMGLVSFGIHEVNGAFSIFHAISIQSLIFLLLAVGVSRGLRNRLATWKIWHGRFMVYSYITLIVTGIAQFFERLPVENTALRAVLFLTLPAVVMWYFYEFRFVPQLRAKSSGH